MKDQPTHQRKMVVRCLAGVTAANLLFFLVDWLVPKIIVGLPIGIGHALIIISHLVLIFLMTGIVFQFFLQLDEYLRLQMLENMAITTMVIFIGSCVYGSLEMVGFRLLSMFMIGPAMGTVFALVTLIRRIAAP
jgi:hypothetical protein